MTVVEGSAHPLRSWTLLDGEIVDPSTRLVAADDRGVLSGDGVYTTMGVFGGLPFAITRHRRRLAHSLELLGLDAAEVPWERVAALPHELGVTDGRLRVTVTAGSGAPSAPVTNPTVLVTVSEVDRSVSTPAMKVVTGSHPREAGRFDAGHKTVAGAGNTRGVLAWAARRRGATECLYRTHEGALSEGTTTNVIVVGNGRAETPDLSTGCLPGITRELLLEAGLVVESDYLDNDDAAGADEVILTSSVRGVIPVDSVDHQPMPGRDGPVWRCLNAYLTDLQATNPDP